MFKNLRAVNGVPVPSLGGGAFTYDANGFLASLKDYDGNVTTYTHDSRGDETSRTLGSGSAIAETIATTWHPTFHLPTQITQGTRTFSFAYDTNGNLTSKSILAPGTSSIWNYTYNASGQVLTATDPRGYVTSYAYDAKGDLTSISNALSQVTHFTSYDADGRPLTMEDPNGLVTTLTYNYRGQVTSRVATTWVTTYGYDAVGQLTGLTRPDHSYLDFSYDAAHRLSGIADSFGSAIVYTLDASSNRIKEQVRTASDTIVRTHSFTYDAVNRLVQSIGAQNQTTVYAYDANSNLLKVLDPLGDATAGFYDELNRLIKTSNPNGGVAAFLYDPQNRLAHVTDPRGLGTSYAYNGFDKPTAVASPDSGSATNSYDVAGNVLTSIDARGKKTTYSYDALNRVTRAAFADGTATAYGYDQGVNGIGRLTSMSDATGTTAWTYEIHGLVTRKVQKNGAITLTTLSPRDAYGRLASMTYPSGATFTYAYNVNAQVAAITYKPASGAAAISLLSNIAYRPFGPVASWLMGHGASYVRGFDQDGRIASLALPVTHNIVLGYDAASRIASIAETGLSAKAFGYDKLNRLTGYASGTNTETFSYDADSNRVGLVVSNGATHSSYAYAYDTKSNRLLTITGSAAQAYGYDASGNTIVDQSAAGEFVFAYDAKNRLASFADGPLSLAYGINGLGQRTYKSNTSTGTSTAVKVSFSYDPAQLYFMYDEAGHLIGQYTGTGVAQQETVWLGDLPVATVQAGTAYYIAPDHLGAPHQITDASQEVVWFWDHDPFGVNATDRNADLRAALSRPVLRPDDGALLQRFPRLCSRDGEVHRERSGRAVGRHQYVWVREGSPLNLYDRFGLEYQDPMLLIADRIAGVGQSQPPKPITDQELAQLLHNLSSEAGLAAAMTEEFPPAAFAFGTIATCSAAGANYLDPNSTEVVKGAVTDVVFDTSGGGIFLELLKQVNPIDVFLAKPAY